MLEVVLGGAVCVPVHIYFKQHVSINGFTVVRPQKSCSSKIIFTDIKPSPSMYVFGEFKIALGVLSYHLWWIIPETLEITHFWIWKAIIASWSSLSDYKSLHSGLEWARKQQGKKGILLYIIILFMN